MHNIDGYTLLRCFTHQSLSISSQTKSMGRLFIATATVHLCHYGQLPIPMDCNNLQLCHLCFLTPASEKYPGKGKLCTLPFQFGFMCFQSHYHSWHHSIRSTPDICLRFISLHFFYVFSFYICLHFLTVRLQNVCTQTPGVCRATWRCAWTKKKEFLSVHHLGLYLFLHISQGMLTVSTLLANCFLDRPPYRLLMWRVRLILCF